MNRNSVGGAGNSSSLTVKNAVIRYNRRNNPELEKRRIHHCDFLGNKQTNKKNPKSMKTKRNETKQRIKFYDHYQMLSK